MVKSAMPKEDPTALAAQAARHPTLIQGLLDGLSARDSSKLRRAKALNLLSTSHPALLYPYFDFFATLLDSPHNILKWNAIIILGNLCAVDSERHFDSVFYRYFRHMWDGDLITAANIIGAAGRIARVRPDLQERIVAEILKVEAIPLPTDECRQIARGKAMLAFAECGISVSHGQPVEELVRRCLQSSRPATRQKAEALLKRPR